LACCLTNDNVLFVGIQTVFEGYNTNTNDFHIDPKPAAALIKKLLSKSMPLSPDP
jgi:hypothetical protein